MLNFIKPSIFFISILTLSIQGCGGGDSSTTYPTTLGTSISVNSTDEGAVMAPNTNTVKSIGQEVSELLKSDITSFNTKTTTLYSKETSYCDISGLIESQNNGDVREITSTQNYENCQEEKSLQHGKINIDYRQMNADGKYPKDIYLTVNEDYSFNNMELKKGLTIESSVSYKADKSIHQITLKINGELTLDSIEYGLLNIEHSINY
jgi:uncharacterized lipoprotein YehR (DUF1307 family)